MKWDLEFYLQRVRSRAFARVPRGGVAVDLGAGTGNFTPILAAEGWTPIAVEYSPGPDLKAMRGVHVVRADARRLPFRDGAVDMVFAKDMLHHVEPPPPALREIRRILREGGHAVLLEPNRRNLLSYLNLTLLQGHDHFTTRRFRELVRAAFPEAVFESFSARVYPRLLGLHIVMRWMERWAEALPGLRRLVSYNLAIARRGADGKAAGTVAQERPRMTIA